MTYAGNYARSLELEDGQDGQGCPPTWHPQPLGPFLDGSYRPPEPKYLQRSDGSTAFYPGSVSDIHGPSGSSKTWLALLACLQAIGDGHRVVYIDFESDAGSITSRLLAMGADPSALAERFSYIAPDESLIVRSTFDRDTRIGAPFRQAVLDMIAELDPALVIIDGVTEAYAIHGLDPRHESDVASWGTLVVRPIAALGPAVVQVDHVPKDGGHGAIGSQHKRSMLTGVSLSVAAKDAFGRGRKGRSYVHIAHGKDRAGQVIANAAPGGESPHWATMVLESDADTGAVRVALYPPDPTGNGSGSARPVAVMERVSDVLVGGPADGFSFTALVPAVGRRQADVKLAVELLAADGYVTVDRGPGNRLGHRLLRPYRGAQDPKVRPENGQ